VLDLSETWWEAEVEPFLVKADTHYAGIVPHLELEGIELLASDYDLNSAGKLDDNLFDSCGSGFQG
jgi:hypothetical protein